MSQTPFEVEVKIPIQDSEKIRISLLGIGARAINTESQIDTYFDHPCKSFWKTDEALRVRNRKPPSDVHALMPYPGLLKEMTYKGPKIDSISKTRAEVSVGIENELDAELLLQHLGFKEVAKITKNRSFYALDDITVSIDDVVGVGMFLELERVVQDKSEVELARNAIMALVKKLELDPSSSIRKSYLELYLESDSQ
jgi:adenylate cyclase class 2